MAPSVIHIDEVEKVFVSDKKRAKEFGGTELFSRIKKELGKEVGCCLHRHRAALQKQYCMGRSICLSGASAHQVPTAVTMDMSLWRPRALHIKKQLLWWVAMLHTPT